MVASHNDRLKLFGTGEAVTGLRRVSLGDLSYEIGPDSVRAISWKGTELVRAITWPMRDPNWVTMRPDILAENTEADAETDRTTLHFQVGDGALDCHVAITGDAAGKLTATIEMTAARDFATNRAGFTILHPIAGVAGSDLAVTHSDGSVEETEFPKLISPGQPVMDIAGLAHSLDGVHADIRFGGEVFEMEDQRNWSDASYKTYCVPLVYPFTYTIPKGETKTQSIEIVLSGGTAAGGLAAAGGSLSVTALDEAAPSVGLAAEDGWAGAPQTRDRVAQCGANHVVARMGTSPADAYLDALKAYGATPDLEVLLADTADGDALGQLAGRLQGAGLSPTRVMALPESYLGSYQPSGPWPDGATPADAAKAARAAFPQAAIGGGVLTNFTELNRCRPDPARCDFITHGNTAVVHAADDRSVIETLEALPQIFESARAIGGDLPYRLGLVSIAGRTNPYGAGPADNSEQIRQTLAQLDPRQRGLFAAAYATGILAATGGQGVEALCLAAPSGPFGIAYEKQDWAQPLFDDNDGAVLYPLFHIVKAAATMADKPRLAISGLPDGVQAYGARLEDGDRMLIANVGPETQRVSLGGPAGVIVLDTASFDAAVRDTGWLDTATADRTDSVDLMPWATAFVQTSGRDA